MAVGPVLPDVLKSGLRIVFCGTAPGNVSAARGAYYAHPQNRFWRTLHEVGLTPRRLAPENYGEMPTFGFGLTDLAKFDRGMDKDLPRGALGAGPCADLRAKIALHGPAVLAFTSLTAGRSFLGSRAMLGESAERIGATRIWVVPSPSPAAAWNFDLTWWRGLADLQPKTV